MCEKVTFWGRYLSRMRNVLNSPNHYTVNFFLPDPFHSSFPLPPSRRLSFIPFDHTRPIDLLLFFAFERRRVMSGEHLQLPSWFLRVFVGPMERFLSLYD